MQERIPNLMLVPEYEQRFGHRVSQLAMQTRQLFDGTPLLEAVRVALESGHPIREFVEARKGSCYIPSSRSLYRSPFL